MPALNSGSLLFRRTDGDNDGSLPREPVSKPMPPPQGFPPVLWAVTVLGILIFFLILRKMSSLKGVVAHGLKTVSNTTKQGAIRLPDDAPDSTAPRNARLDVPAVPQRRFSISEDPESDTTSSDVGSGDDRHGWPTRQTMSAKPTRKFAGRVPEGPKPKTAMKPTLKPKNQGQ